MDREKAAVYLGGAFMAVIVAWVGIGIVSVIAVLGPNPGRPT